MDANIGDATRSPTIKAEDKIPSSKLLKLNSPLQHKQCYVVTSKMTIIMFFGIMWWIKSIRRTELRYHVSIHHLGCKFLEPHLHQYLQLLLGPNKLSCLSHRITQATCEYTINTYSRNVTTYTQHRYLTFEFCDPYHIKGVSKIVFCSDYAFQNNHSG